MNKPITRLQHGFIDYPYVAVVSTAPVLFGFRNEPAAVLMCRVLSGSILVSSIFTRAEWGVLRVVPFKTHLALDVLGSVTALSAPWLMGFSGNRQARNTFLMTGLFGLAAVLLTRPEELP